MKQQSKLDAHIVKQYASVNTNSSLNTTPTFNNDPDILWNTLGAMALMNLATRKISNNAA